MNAIPPSWNTIAKAVMLFQEGKKSQAFGMIAKMRIKTALSKEEHKTIQIAAEMMNGLGANLYSQMGYKLEEMEQKASDIFTRAFIEKN